MITSEQIERAERTLKIVYGGPFDKQLERLSVEREAFDNFLSGNVAIIKRRYGNAWQEMDPRMEPAIATLMAHMFLTGLLCGHHERDAQA